MSKHKSAGGEYMAEEVRTPELEDLEIPTENDIGSSMMEEVSPQRER